jgi:hypothetical protein
MPEETKFLTLAFVDVPNIVEVRETHGESGAREFLKKSTESLNAIRRDHGGALIRSVGSTMLLAFDRIEDAVRATCEIQAVTELWDNGGPAPIFRIGVHCGEVIMRNGSAVGDAVSTSARLVTNAKPGQSLCSAVIAEQAPASLRGLLAPLDVDETTIQRFNGPLYEIIWRADGESAGGIPAEGAPEPRPVKKLDVDTIKTQTAPLSIGDQAARRKIKLTKMQRKGVAEDPASGAAIAEQAAIARAEDTARLCLVWDRHVVVVDARRPAVTIGRADANDITVSMDTASRQHAHVEWRNGEYYLVDHSWNGTYLYDEEGVETLVHNDEVKLDEFFKMSFMTDIAKGMEYLHKTQIGSHGNLKSPNCLVDGRWTVRVSVTF